MLLGGVRAPPTPTTSSPAGWPARSVGDEVEIVIVSADASHSFHGFTGEVDLVRRAVAFERTDGSPASVGYDQLIVGTGGREPAAPVPGLAEHGFPLRAPDEIEALGELPLAQRRAVARAGAELRRLGVRVRLGVRRTEVTSGGAQRSDRPSCRPAPCWAPWGNAR